MTDNAAYMPGYSIGEEACNIVSHAVGTCLGVFATIVMAVASIAQGDLLKLSAVSYTHLDVYKRQATCCYKHANTPFLIQYTFID